MIKEGLSAFKGKRVLLLQGPLGPFFRRLACDIENAGAQVFKINFNGGDWMFFPKGAISFTGRPAEWPAFFEQVLIDQKIDMVLLFGDCRPVHRAAHEIAAARGVEIGVFEEGYIRPDYITLERFGVNGHSQIPRTPDFYLNTPQAVVPATKRVGNMFWYAVLWALLYYIASALLWPKYRHYQHHRPLTLREAGPWIRSAYRKIYYRFKEHGVQTELSTTYKDRFFLVPLQVHNDAQVHVHSEFNSVEDFIDRVMSSFAAHSPADSLLVIKHHPMDRGYHDYTRLINRLAREYGIQKRARYIHDQHLPTLLEHARGAVVINSTVGLSALHHGTPLKVCGTAIYDIAGLTYQCDLDHFWREAHATTIRKDLYDRFQRYLIEHTQLNGSFYRRLEIAGSHTGLVWAPSSEARAVEESLLASGEFKSISQ